jgi:hypothetical protein
MITDVSSILVLLLICNLFSTSFAETSWYRFWGLTELRLTNCSVQNFCITKNFGWQCPVHGNSNECLQGPTVCLRARSQNCEKRLVSFVMSVRPHGTTRLPVDRFSWNLIFEYFSKIWRENSGFLKIWQESRALYVKICVHLWYGFTQFLVKSETF